MPDDPPPRASWGAVLTAHEPAQLLLANVGWHIGTGAAEVHVYLDDPYDAVLPRLAAIPGVRAVACDDAHWRRVAPSGRRPPTHRRRQALNANDALKQCSVDWLVHLDADEFLVQDSPHDRPLGAEMAAVRELECELYFPVAERLYLTGPQASIWEGVFRTCTRSQIRRGDGIDNDRVIYGDHVDCLDFGVLGHSAGKCAVPVDGDFRLGIHWAFRGTGRRRAERFRSTAARLLHFDGLTQLQWLTKLRRYTEYDPADFSVAAHRQAQIDLAAEAGAVPGGHAALHDELKVVSPAAQARLRAFGLLYEVPFDPVPVLRRVLGEVPDFSVDAFDAELRRRLPERTKGLP
ncbi:glycosyltransferase family 2 protein [Roseovarius dicentrarchi]|uniref:glycosyltransferase family 2 protein n=1 Tax=Roseovarius dicentrarchi TaxID=2250573 RepID=UPI000DEB273D|nr:glycosyltransferase family 2 protein [Roseovarius dicentrarchi]